MKQVKIVSGIYGYRPPNSKQVKPMRAGNIASVPEEEAARLVELGVAALIETETKSETESSSKTKTKPSVKANSDTANLDFTQAPVL